MQHQNRSKTYKKQVFNYHHLKLRYTYAQCVDCLNHFPSYDEEWECDVEIDEYFWNTDRVLLCWNCAVEHFAPYNHIMRHKFLFKRKYA